MENQQLTQLIRRELPGILWRDQTPFLQLRRRRAAVVVLTLGRSFLVYIVEGAN